MLFALLLGCTLDPNGHRCTYFAAVSDGDTLYCIEEDAPASCDRLVDGLIAAFESCLGRRFDEEEARIAAEEAVDCDAAVATTESFEPCLELLAEPECGADDIPIIPSECDAAVLVEAE